MHIRVETWAYCRQFGHLLTGKPPDLLGKVSAVKGVSGSSAKPSCVTAFEETPITVLFISETSESDAVSSLSDCLDICESAAEEQ